MNKQKFQAGVTLVELILVILAIFALVTVINNLPSSLAAVSRNRHNSIARDIATKQMEYLRRLNYDNLPPGGAFADTALLNLPFSAASFEVNECPLSICTSGDPLKEPAKVVKVKVGWREMGEDKNVELTTIISKGGLGQ